MGLVYDSVNRILASNPLTRSDFVNSMYVIRARKFYAADDINKEEESGNLSTEDKELLIDAVMEELSKRKDKVEKKEDAGSEEKENEVTKPDVEQTGGPIDKPGEKEPASDGDKLPELPDLDELMKSDKKESPEKSPDELSPTEQKKPKEETLPDVSVEASEEWKAFDDDLTANIDDIDPGKSDIELNASLDTDNIIQSSIDDSKHIAADDKSEENVENSEAEDDIDSTSSGEDIGIEDLEIDNDIKDEKSVPMPTESISGENDEYDIFYRILDLLNNMVEVFHTRRERVSSDVINDYADGVEHVIVSKPVWVFGFDVDKNRSKILARRIINGICTI